ncbi:MAG: TIGR02444 family protein [Alphaproteobacteria bacterium]
MKHNLLREGYAHNLRIFALTVYSSPGIEQACLSLQEDHCAPIPFLLFCLWAAPLEDTTLRTLYDLTCQWEREVIKPLRQVRRSLKKELPVLDVSIRESLRTKIKTAELEAEFLLLDDLAAHSRGPAGSASEAQRKTLLGFIPQLSENNLQLCQVIQAATLFWHNKLPHLGDNLGSF